MLLGIAIGDAFGAGYEMQSRNDIRKNFDFSKYRVRPKWRVWRPGTGRYTDDTQMSLAIAELLLSEELFTVHTLADFFVESFRRDPRPGYSKGFQKILEQVRSGRELIAALNPNSTRNGAAMRAVPIGTVRDIDMVIQHAVTNAKVTHDTPSGIASSVCVAAAAHYFLWDIGDPSGVFDYCIRACQKFDPISTRHFEAISRMQEEDPLLLFGKEKINFGVPVDAMRTAGAVLYLISRFSDDPTTTLQKAVLLGGDTDSVAAVALGIVASRAGLEMLPDFLLSGLENGPYGRDYIASLGEDLIRNGS